MFVGRKAAGALLAVCAAWLGGCGDGLGECDPTVLGGDPATGMPYAGQAIVATRCAGGICHSETAVGDERRGAPADLNFDVGGGSGSDADRAKLARMLGVVVDWSEDMWDEIEGGTMPPEKPAGSGELSSADKEAVRNWLACGAAGIPPDPSARTATWESIWSSLGNSCVGCHNMAGSGNSGGAVLGEAGDACGSYDKIVGQNGVVGECTGMPLVTPFEPQNSHLLLKLKADPAMCGGPMPYPSTTGLIETDAELVGLIETWIMNGAMPPSCP
jgi:hypothetical protein